MTSNVPTTGINVASKVSTFFVPGWFAALRGRVSPSNLKPANALWLLLVMVLGVGAVYPPQVVAIPPNEIYGIGKPATVLIEVKWKFSLSVPNPSLSATELAKFTKEYLKKEGKSRTTLNTGKAVFILLTKKPLSFVESGTKLKEVEFTPSGVFAGSGFIVNPNGYIVTNAHVLTLKGAYIESVFARFIPQSELRKALNSLKNKLPELWNLSQADERTVSKALLIAFAKACRMHGKVRWRRFLRVTLSGSTGAAEGKPVRYPAQTQRMGRPYPNKDVAIIKIEAKGLPNLTLGDEETVKVGDQIYVIGYPGQAFIKGRLQESSRYEATITAGIVSSRKKAPTGWTVLQTDANMSGGNSGGPVLNSNGHVIGVATWGSSSVTGASTGYNFIVPSSVIKELLRSLNVKYQEMRP